jgi:hypothetical protein
MGSPRKPRGRRCSSHRGSSSRCDRIGAAYTIGGGVRSSARTRSAMRSGSRSPCGRWSPRRSASTRRRGDLDARRSRIARSAAMRFPPARRSSSARGCCTAIRAISSAQTSFVPSGGAVILLAGCPVRLHPVWWRTSYLHRQSICHDGGGVDPGDDCTTVPARMAERPSGGTVALDHTAPEGRGLGQTGAARSIVARPRAAWKPGDSSLRVSASRAEPIGDNFVQSDNFVQ